MDFDTNIRTYNVASNVPFFDRLTFATYLGTDTDTIYTMFVNGVHNYYKHFYINKDTRRVVPFSYGLRLRRIDAPKSPLKDWQAKLADLFATFPAHPANKAFIAGSSILEAAKSAIPGDVLVHVDLKDFFPSHTALYVKRRLAELFFRHYNTALDGDILFQIAKVVTLNGVLPQGSPCSPILTVVLNYDLDVRVAACAEKYGLEYSRYADDLWFTGKQPDNVIQEFLYDLQDALHPFQMNYKKVNIMRNRAYPKFTGVVLKSKNYMASTMSGKISKYITEQLKLKNSKTVVAGNSITIEGIFEEEIPVDEITAKIQELSEFIARKYPKLVFTLRPRYFYIQTVKKCLGLTITDDKVAFPRKKYNDLRLQAMLMGRQRALFAIWYALKRSFPKNNQGEVIAQPMKMSAPYVYASISKATNSKTDPKFRNLLEHPFNRRVFLGHVAYLKSIDPEKGAKIIEIEHKAYNKCLEGYKNWYFRSSTEHVIHFDWMNKLSNAVLDYPEYLEELDRDGIPGWALQEV